VQLSDADRDELIELLSRHASEDRLDTAELERRVEIVLSAATREQAQAVLADLPLLPPAGAPGAGAGRGRRRGHNEAERVGADWSPTEERFREPRTGRIMRVWVDRAGGRHYVAE
jgi:hypothetical protein